MGKDRVGDDECDNVSLFDSILDQFGISKLTQGREKAFTQAFYNSITLILIIICTVIVVLTILQPFIKPLLWAVLCGSVLHPFKFRLSYSFKRWLCYLENSSKPLSIEIASLPILILSNLSQFVGNIIISKFSAVCVGLFIASYLLSTLYDYTPNTCFCVFWKVYSVSESLSNFVMDVFQSTVVITLVLIGFISALALMWDSKKSKIFLIASYITWISLACYVSSFFDYLRLPVLILLMTTCIFGLVFESSLPCHTKEGNTKEGGRGMRSPVLTPIGLAFTILFCIFLEMTPLKRAALQRSISNQENDIIFSKINYIEDIKDTKEHVTHFKIKNENVQFAEETRDSVFESESQPNNDGLHNEYVDPDMSSGDYKCLSDLSGLLQNPHTSDLYIYSMCIGCGVIVIVKNLWLLYFIAFLFVIHLTKLFCIGFGIWLLIQEFWATFTNQLKVWYSSRQEIIIPPPVAAFFKMAAFVKKYILSCLQNCCDAVASVTVILAVLAATIFVSTFLCIQMYTEGFYMVKVSGQIINQTVVHNPELTQLLPEGWEDQLDSALNSAYTYGRELLSNNLHRMLQDVPEDKAKELERTALELWDRVYQAWVMTSIEQSFGPKVTSTAVFQTWGQFLDGVQKTPGLMNIRNLNSLVLENMATLSSGLESVWVIVKGNASILLQAVTTLLCVVARHGAALFSFFIDVVIFLTALFYLLNSSRALYKPVEILTNMIPQHGHKLAVAMETASKEVIVASFKLLVFYGLWTWFIHSIFLMNIIYLPSVFAAILAVVPVLGTYWACLPGVLDLWLAQGKGIHALCLAICQFLPTTIVDTTIYNEIHGGHPYLTGLAVAGGVLCLGTEGAIIGPLALCGLLVVINLLSGFLQDSLSPPS